jgi:hypothetical protein
MTPSGIESTTFLLVTQCLNQLSHRVPPHYIPYFALIIFDLSSNNKSQQGEFVRHFLFILHANYIKLSHYQQREIRDVVRNIYILSIVTCCDAEIWYFSDFCVFLSWDSSVILRKRSPNSFFHVQEHKPQWSCYPQSTSTYLPIWGC